MGIHRKEKNRTPDITADQIMNLIERDDIKIVSFDLFDTLLVRPSILPTDIFFLLQEKVKAAVGLDFIELRYNAEEELGDEFATFDDIWVHIAEKNNLDEEKLGILKQAELNLERDMLTVRRDTKQIYDAAVQAGKRIIVTSDMYLPSAFLKNVLIEKGFSEVDEVYVSCEAKARKESGKLYKYVLAKENLTSPAELLHIGDNFQSDLKMAIRQGITAVFYPSVWDLTMDAESPWGRALRNNGISLDPIMRIMVSFAFLRAWNKNDSPLFGTKCFTSLEDFADLLLAPMLSDLAVELLCNPEIQEQYPSLNFAARDGFLPQKIYDVIGKNRPHIPSRYLYASRQALCFASFDSFSDFFEKARWEGKSYLLEDFLSVFIVDERIRKKILNNLSESEKEINLCETPELAENVLSKFSNDLEAYFSLQKELSVQYYHSTLSKTSDRQIVFDCGYSGSVSTGLIKACGIPFDKYYLWETESNRQRDEKAQTKTICFFSGDPLLGFNILFEECFSPLAGSCIGFQRSSGSIKPVLEHLEPDARMQLAMETLLQSCVSFAESFEQAFRPYLPSMRSTDKGVYLRAAQYAFLNSPYNELSIFEPITFPDSHGITLNLAKKSYENFTMLKFYGNSFSGTMFENPDTLITLPEEKEPDPGYRVGIHLHLYNTHLYEEILGYLETITYPFDLIVTVTDEKVIPVLQRFFQRDFIPSLRALKIILSENRGRDVAPWLVETRSIQSDYDLFCHIHSKESAQYGPNFGDEWRHYLYDNLIDGNALNRIIRLFQSDRKLGLVFPKCFSKIKNTHNDLDIPVSGDFGEDVIIRDLCHKMGIDEYFSRDNFIWSMGTMMWYRPKALHPLFSLGLEYEDFPEEPIGPGGTIAHAIERITSIVVKNSGFETRQFNYVEEAGSNFGVLGILYPGCFNPHDQVAWRIGIKQAILVLIYAHIFFIRKKLGLLHDSAPKLQTYKPYEVARSLGLKSAWIILRKTIGIYILK